MQFARLLLGGPELRIGSVADLRRFLVHTLCAVLLPYRRLRSRFQVIGKRVAARSLKQRLQMRVAPNAGREFLTIDLDIWPRLYLRLR